MDRSPLPPLGMARQTRRARPHVSRHPSMLVVHLRLAMLVAVDAGERPEVARRRVTVRARESRVRAAPDREAVLECRSLPRRRPVTELAGRREPGRAVLGVAR